MFRNYVVAKVVVGVALGVMLAVGVALVLREQGAVAAADLNPDPDPAPHEAPVITFSGQEELYQYLVATKGVEKAEEYRLGEFDKVFPNLREEVNRTIEELRRADPDDVLKQRLSVFHGGESQSPLEFHRGGYINWIVACMRDRRVSRLYQILRDMPAEEAQRTCRRLFVQARNTIDAAWEKYREARAGGNMYPDLAPRDAAYMTSCTVLLSSQFCNTDTVLGQLASWKAGNLKHKAAALLLDDPIQQVKLIAEETDPHDLFTIHILMLLLDREGKLTPEVLAKARGLGLPEERRIDMMNWVMPADAGFFNESEKQQYVVRTFSVTYCWTSTYTAEAEIQHVKNYLWGVLKPGEHPPADPERTPAAP